LVPIFDRTSEQELNQALIASRWGSLQKILATIDTLDLKFLAWLNAVLLPDCGRQNTLSLAGDGRVVALAALKHIGQESRINALRVNKYGINLDDGDAPAH
jgi:hypothetical protein